MAPGVSAPSRPCQTCGMRALLALALVSSSLLLAACSSGPPTRTARPPVYRELTPQESSNIAIHALGLVGTPYRYGGNTPQGGFDCSGLVYYVFSHVAQGSALPRRLPRSTAEWAAATQPVDDAALQRGDLVFFNTTGALFSHMGIYVGQAQFVHAPSSGGTVRRDSLEAGYFRTRYVGARRVFAPA